jgi:hypothetical protein
VWRNARESISVKASDQKLKGNAMKTKVFVFAATLNAFATASMWAQSAAPDPNLLAQLEKRLAKSDSEAKRLTGAPKSLWLLREVKIQKIIERLKAGEPVDTKELDVVLSDRVN